MPFGILSGRKENRLCFSRDTGGKTMPVNEMQPFDSRAIKFIYDSLYTYFWKEECHHHDTSRHDLYEGLLLSSLPVFCLSTSTWRIQAFCIHCSSHAFILRVNIFHFIAFIHSGGGRKNTFSLSCVSVGNSLMFLEEASLYSMRAIL